MSGETMDVVVGSLMVGAAIGFVIGMITTFAITSKPSNEERD